MDDAAVAEPVGAEVGFADEIGTETGVGAAGKDGDGFKNGGVDPGAASRLTEIGKTEAESFEFLVAFGKQYEFGVDQFAQGKVLGEKIVFGRGR